MIGWQRGNWHVPADIRSTAEERWKQPAVTVMTRNSFRRVAYKMHPAALTQRKAETLQRFTTRKVQARGVQMSAAAGRRLTAEDE